MIRLLVVKEFTAVSNHHHSTGDLGSWSNLHTKFYILNDVIWNLLLDFTSDKLLYVDCELQFSTMNLKILQKKCIHQFISPFVNGILKTKLPKYKKCYSECSQCSIHLKHIYNRVITFPPKNFGVLLKVIKIFEPFLYYM